MCERERERDSVCVCLREREGERRHAPMHIGSITTLVRRETYEQKFVNEPTRKVHGLTKQHHARPVSAWHRLSRRSRLSPVCPSSAVTPTRPGSAPCSWRILRACRSNTHTHSLTHTLTHPHIHTSTHTHTHTHARARAPRLLRLAKLTKLLRGASAHAVNFISLSKR